MSEGKPPRIVAAGLPIEVHLAEGMWRVVEHMPPNLIRAALLLLDRLAAGGST